MHSDYSSKLWNRQYFMGTVHRTRRYGGRAIARSERQQHHQCAHGDNLIRNRAYLIRDTSGC